jgi:hypothetical protein
MRTSNLANEAVRQAEVGQVWEEQLSGAAGTLVMDTFRTFRVRAAGAVTVTIDGTLAATMISGEILLFNSGSGQPVNVGAIPGGPMGVTSRASQTNIVITGTAFVQVARDNVRKVNQ